MFFRNWIHFFRVALLMSIVKQCLLLTVMPIDNFQNKIDAYSTAK